VECYDHLRNVVGSCSEIQSLFVNLSVRQYIVSTTVFFKYCAKQTTRLIKNNQLLRNKKLNKLVVILRSPTYFQLVSLFSVLQYIFSTPHSSCIVWWWVNMFMHFSPPPLTINIVLSTTTTQQRRDDDDTNPTSNKH
jgi:hypothetical protein